MTLKKEKLLSLGYFIDNEYLDFYCELINKNINNIKEENKTELHHIIPRAVYKLSGIESASKAPNKQVNKNNLVNLKYKDHLLAHYYLCLCANKEYKKAACYTFTRMVSVINKEKRPTLDSFSNCNLEEYEKLKYEANLYMIENRKVRNKHIFKDDLNRISVTDLYNYYIIEKHTMKECAVKFNTTQNTIGLILKLNKIYKKLGYNPDIFNIITKEMLYTYYITEEHS